MIHNDHFLFDLINTLIYNSTRQMELIGGYSQQTNKPSLKFPHHLKYYLLIDKPTLGINWIIVLINLIFKKLSIKI